MNDCEKLDGKVVRVKRSIAYVEIVRSSACEGCKACALASKKVMTLPAANDIGAKPQDKVLVSLAPQKPLVATLMLFLLPLVLMIIALVITSTVVQSELMLALYAFSGLTVGLIIAFVFDKFYYSKKYVSHVIKILNTRQGDNYD